MDISVFYDHVIQAAGQLDRPEALLIPEIRDCGISAFEINLTYLLENPDKYNLILQNGMNISCIYEFYDLTGYSTTRGRDAAGRGGVRTSFEDLKLHIETAAGTGARKILVVPGFLSAEEADRLGDCTDRKSVYTFMDGCPAVRSMCGALRDAVGYAGRFGIKVTLEDFDDLRSPYGTPDGLMWFMENVPGLGLTFDTGNFVLRECDVLEAYGLLSEYIVHVHCKDRGETSVTGKGAVNRGMAPAAVGEGYIPVHEIINRLRQSGYGSYLAVEHFDAPDQMGCIRRSAENIRRFIV
jgi:L-ribulose-5-phosphate 3-epimerase